MVWVASLHMKQLRNAETNGKCICKGRPRLASNFKPVNVVHLVDETWEDQEEGGSRYNNIRGRNRRFA
jgi:hypothetical protein